MKVIPQEEFGTWRPIELISRARYLYDQSHSEEHFRYLQDVLSQFSDTKEVLPFHHLLNPDGRDEIDHLIEDVFFQDGCPLALISHPRYLPLNWHDHNFYELVYVCQGGCDNLLEGVTLTMRQGDFCILPPNQRHTIRCFRDDGLVLNILIRKSTFRQSFQQLLSDFGLLSEFFSHTLFQKENSSYLLFRCGEDDAIRQIVLDMHREYLSRQPFSQAMLSGQLILLLGHLMRGHQLDAIYMTGRDRSHPAHIAKMLRYMDEHIASVTLHEIALQFSYSEGRCSSLIKTATGKTFTELLREGKAKRAVRLLQETDWSLSRIAEEAGFCDASHMNKVFTVLYGQTPAKYRQDGK